VEEDSLIEDREFIIFLEKEGYIEFFSLKKSTKVH